MPKTIEKDITKKEKKQKVINLKEIVFNSSNLALTLCLVIVCLLFIPTLNRQWLIYDDRIIYENLYFSTPKTFGEIFEILDSFGFKFNLISSNVIYSSNFVVRTCPLANVFWLTINFIFQNKDPVLYHSVNLILHLINTCIVFHILKFVLGNKTNQILIPILTLLWATHPVIMESVLLTSNSGATFTYMFFFAFLLDFLKNKDRNTSTLRKTLIPILYLTAMLTNEYIITLPFVLFAISFYKNYKTNPLKMAITISLKETLPYFTGFVIYLIYFFFFSSYRSNNFSAGSQLIVFTERVFWLAPQIFFHFLTLILYPKILSIDQTLFVKLGKTLFDPYSVFCILFFF
ncbi:MAG: hypothetical protein HY094_07955, partial [Candidatus Melainabacteria bacterium]|nr:hypothetical protein [Candidatus Melainabacteria bacterium]